MFKKFKLKIFIFPQSINLFQKQIKSSQYLKYKGKSINKSKTPIPIFITQKYQIIIKLKLTAN